MLQLRLHLLWTQDMNLPHECQHDLFECKDDLKKSQTSLSVIAKNLDCKYANQVRNHWRLYIYGGLATIIIRESSFSCVTSMVNQMVIVMALKKAFQQENQW